MLQSGWLKIGCIPPGNIRHLPIIIWMKRECLYKSKNNPQATDDQLQIAEKLWEVSAKLTKAKT